MVASRKECAMEFDQAFEKLLDPYDPDGDHV